MKTLTFKYLKLFLRIFHPDIIFSMAIEIKIQFLIAIVPIGIIKRICPGTTAKIKGFIIVRTVWIRGNVLSGYLDGHDNYVDFTGVR